MDALFPDLNFPFENTSGKLNLVILALKNAFAGKINCVLIQRFLGKLRQHYNFYEITDTFEQRIKENFLNTLMPNGLPP